MNGKIKLALATGHDMAEIDQIRHRVYATELGQFRPSPEKTLHDRNDVDSIYIVAFEKGELVGFVGVTPPQSPSYSIDNYLARDSVPLDFDDALFEIRALTVVDQLRGTPVAPALMYAAFRLIQDGGGKQLVAIGHRNVRSMYIRLGMRPAGQRFQCGRLDYELLTASSENIETELTRFKTRLDRLERQVDWQLDVPFRAPVECYHGGAFFDAIGNTFHDLARRNEIINADVLDAWFPPCPEAQQALHEHLGWIMRTSPPNHAEGLTQAIAQARGIQPGNILPGGGSSPLIFLAFRHWLTPASRVLLLNPTYGEYAHVLDKVVGCQVERFNLRREDGYAVDTERLAAKLREGFDLVVLVNPNSPTGRHIPRSRLEELLATRHPKTRVWIDETYVEYAGHEQSLEPFAAQNTGVVVVKSMSKVYGLSGLRVGHLCAAAKTLEPLRGLTPPWSVSLPAQVAAVHALRCVDYYNGRYQETHRLRAGLMDGLRSLGIEEIVPGIANFILFHLPGHGPDGKRVIDQCREHGLFIRDAADMGSGMGDRAIRIAVKDAATNDRMLGMLGHALNPIAAKEVCRA
ncbi:Threonine-phosphate decarboxylase [Pontiella desulfatans]|uniref:Aminotransferase n=1 Tax=Pontiella desulfatans TaxID=2750659 RepID=A0A6C2TZ32_PONDE|nr:aminotransferase class I/II-fold pyridoxal phosphate-dependent enzyme [Pontiella desulfatans]VGO12978.1 Threonine-phosphate decarboxylase [Pontiella desulfatans]